MLNYIRDRTHSLKLLYIALFQKIWLRHATIGIFSVLISAFALWFSSRYPDYYFIDITTDSLISLFTIFASSMLSVATFTVSAIVTATSSATQSTTPRASRLIIVDNKAQLVLSSFIAAFIYSVVNLISLRAFNYDRSGRFILFVFLIAILVLVLISFIQWVDHITKLGRQSNTLEKLVGVASESINKETVNYLCAKPFAGDVPAESIPVRAKESGYITSINMHKLQKLAEEHYEKVILPVYPGDFVTSETIVAYVQKPSAEDDKLDDIRSAVILSEWRDSVYDVRFNVLNLAEAADKALSPGINDPGTAINILNKYFPLFQKLVKLSSEFKEEDVKYDRVYVVPLNFEDLVLDAFTPIARDGAAIVEVGVRLQKILSAIHELGNSRLSTAAYEMAEQALELSEQNLAIESHKQRVRSASVVVGLII